eukprot:Trichotokara_eunicae@DN11071_c0_g1_i1.p1
MTMRLEQRLDWNNPKEKIRVHSIRRAREVGQSITQSIPGVLRAFKDALVVLIKSQPTLCFFNGPGTAVPLVLLAKLLEFIGVIPPVRLFYVESVARVKKLSLSARICRPFVTTFASQWPNIPGWRGGTLVE